MPNSEYDLIIVGGGPAGLTSGLYASRAKLKTLMIEKLSAGGQLLVTNIIENYPGFESITGAELSERMEKQAKEWGLEIVQDAVSSVELSGNDKIVKTVKGQYKAKAIIVATGAEPRKLGVPGEKEFWGRGVSYCALCDGAFYRNKTVVVVGGGDSALEEGLYLTRLVNKIHLVHRRDALRASKILQDRALENKKFEFIWNSVVTKIEGEKTVKSVLIKNVKDNSEKPVACDGIFVYIGMIPNTGFLKGVVKLDEAGYVITDVDAKTSAPGIYAAGDVCIKKVRQITTAVSDATIAAVEAGKYIEEL